MNKDSVFYSETLDELYRVKKNIADEYLSLSDYYRHLRDVEREMRASGVRFCRLRPLPVSLTPCQT